MPPRQCAKTVIVVDASVLVVALADDAADGDMARARLRGERLLAPELVDLEVLSVLRRHESSGRIDPRRAQLAVEDLVTLPIERAPHGAMARRVWELRRNLTPYDAAYVALAEAADAVLLTADAHLRRATGPRCAIEVLHD
jgi:predicted nucleic acid-binding protein